MDSNKMKNTSNVFLIIGIIFVAFNLRPAITSVGPIIDLIRTDLGISNGIAGFITTLPLISFAILSILAPKIGQSIGNELTIFLGLMVLCIGIITRSVGYTSTLFLGTLLIGVGVAIGNVLIPSIVKLHFPLKVGIITSIYTTAMNTFAAIGSGVSIPLVKGQSFGWRWALAFWVVLSVVAMIMWLPQLRNNFKPSASSSAQSSNRAMWRSSIAWQVTLFMGLQSFLFYCTVAWLPEILESHGMQLSMAGWMVSLMQLVGLPTTFIAPVIANRLKNQKLMVCIIGLVYFAGVMGLIFVQTNGLLILSIICIGAAQGASISLALTMIGLRTKDSRQAANLSGMAQSIGYLLAAIGPTLVGFLFDFTLSWLTPLIIFSVVTILMTIAGVGAGRNRYVTGALTQK
ncbi:CynX/NimT family MFS transporter [Bacillus sp. REN16]|uniref:CynX/NimT family MFS transporter n=1 Tax=Bacillus sp. REN16 TaxID=2887296 RepID=UPI001E329B64|nr:MFS transporter [Bacillus sp. REN16]MCC3355947.1 MFS transporter [Bacillus sp. REN16]